MRFVRWLLLLVMLACAGPSCLAGRLVLAGRTVKARISSVARPDGSEASYFFLEPDGAARYPLVLYLHGSSCQSVSATLGYFPPLLAEGFGVVVPEKRGVQPGDEDRSSCSPEFLDHNDRYQRLDDVELVMEALPSRLARWDGRLIVIGGSEGGALAPAVAVRHRARTVALVLMAGGTWEMRREIRFLEEKELRASGTSAAGVARALGDLDTQLAEMEANPVASRTWRGAANTYKMWASYLGYRPLDYLIHVDCPVYVVHGGRDAAVPVESSEAAVTQFTMLGKANLTYRRYPDLDHRWNDQHGASHFREVGLGILDWIVARVPRTR